MATGTIPSNDKIRIYNLDVSGTEITQSYQGLYWVEFPLSGAGKPLEGATLVSVAWHNLWYLDMTLVLHREAVAIVCPTSKTIPDNVSLDIRYTY